MSVSPLLICTRCCSLSIDGPEHPEDEDLMHCRSCGRQVTYRMMRAEIEMALSFAVLQIRSGVARKMASAGSISSH